MLFRNFKFLIIFIAITLKPCYYLGQCLTMTCPPSVTVNAPANACSAVVAYNQPTVNCLSCTSNTQIFTYTGSMQNFTVPPGITAVTILAYGARGGFNTSSTFQPGRGAAVRGSFVVTPGSVLRVLVGECPSITTGNGNGGGGASYVTTSTSVALIVAGGGGGSSATTDSPNKHGNITTIGGNGAAGGGIGGAGGNGGGVGGVGFQSGAGGGFFTNGAVGWAAGSDGKSFMNGAGGGLVAAWAFARGGYGGGGQGSAFVVGGGGGGYSGGGSGGNVAPGGGVGGGGASFNAGIVGCTSATAGLSNGHGSVIISYGTSTVLPVLASGLSSGSNFPVGVSVVTYSANDGSGNTTNCSFSVTVRDVTSPTITCPGNVNQCTAIVNGIAPVSFIDNCPSPAITYSLSGATTGTGLNNASGLNFNPGTTTVTYLATDASGNVGSCSFSVVTGVAPTLTIAASSLSVCPGNSVSLTASGASTYTWSPGISNGVAFTPSTTLTYSVIGTSAGGCTSTANQLITVNTSPNIVTTNPATCVGGAINLSSSGGLNYLWSGPNSYTSNLQNPTIINAQTNMSGAYSVTVTSAQGCSSVAISNVTVNTVPSPAVGSNTPCLGSVLNLTTAAATSYSWSGPNLYSSNLQNPSIVNFTALNSGVYTVNVTNVSGCIGSSTLSVNFNSLPIVNATSSGTFCVGQTINLNGSGGVSAAWSGPSGFTSTSFSPSIPTASIANNGNYTLTVTSVNGCTNSAVTPIVVNSLPVIVINNPTTCVNGALILSANGGTNYSWLGPTSFNSNLQNPTISPATLLNSGAYTVIVTGANSCTNAAISNATVFNLPLVTASNLSVCIGGSINLTSSGAVNYSWIGPNMFSSLLQNPTISNAGVINIGAYTVTGTSAQGCTNVAVANVSVGVVNLPSMTSNTPCAGFNLNFSTPSANSYTWAGPGSFTSSLQNPLINNASLTNSGIYSLTTINSAGCIASNTLAVTVNSLPLLSTSSSSTVCALSSVNFTASGGNTIIWNGPNSFSSNAYSPIISPVAPANSGNYSVTVTNLSGCTASTTINLLVNPLPVIISTNSINVCEGLPINLTSSGGVNYSWVGPNAFSSNLQNPVIQNSNISNSGAYEVVVSSAASCTSSALVIVNVNAAPTGTASSNSPICENNRLTLFGSNSNSYAWSGPNGFVSLIQNPEINNITTAGSGVYTLTISNALGCSRSIQLPVTIFPLPSLSLQASKKEACVPECISFNAVSNASGNNVVYNWNLDKSLTTSINGANASGCYNQLGNYKPTVQVIDANGCSRTTSVDITLNPNPEPNFIFEPNKPTLYNNVVDLNYLKNNDKIAAYEWYVNNNPSSAWTPNTSHKFEETGDYYVTLVVISDKGCKGSVTKLIRVEDEFSLFIPNAFTPNDDGKNDVFLPKGTAFKNYNLGIFNRWGELLFNSNEFNVGWDGTFKGEKCQDGVYTYKINVIIEGGKAKEFVGKVSLLK